MPDIAFIKTPDPLVLTGNPINFRIACKNAFGTVGVKSIVKICTPGTGSIQVGKYLRFVWNGNTVTFTCAATPDGLQFPAITNATQLLPYLANSAILINDFVLSVESNYYLVLTARQPGTIYELTISTDQPAGESFGFFGGNSTTGVNAATKNFKVCLKPEINDSFVTTIDLPVQKPGITDNLPDGFDNTTGIATIDMSELLKKFTTGNFIFPEPDSGYFAKHTTVNKFRLYAFAKDGFPPTISTGVYSSEINYIQGKLRNFSLGELNSLDKTFYDKLTESKMFLTLAPLEKQSDIYAPERLYFLFINAGTCKMWAKEYYDDGTVNNSIRVTFSVAAFDIVEFFAGYKHIRTNSPKKMVKYDIYITDKSDNILSETRTFVMDYRYQAYARYFFAKNSFCVYDCFRTTGKTDKTRNIKKDFIYIPLLENFTEIDREEKQIYAETETAYAINSGFFPDKYHSEWFQEFLESDDVFWLKRGKAYPVSIKDSKQKVSIDGDFNPFTEFNLTHQIHDDFTEEFTAQEPINIGDFNVDFNTDYFTGAVTPEPPTGNYQTLFESDFSSWVSSSGQYPSIPDGFTLSGTAGTEIVNSSGKLQMNMPGSAERHIVLALTNPAYLNPGTYRVSFWVEEITDATNGLIYLFVSGNHPDIYHALRTAGQFIYEFTMSEMFFFQISAVDSNIRIDNFKLEMRVS